MAPLRREDGAARSLQAVVAYLAHLRRRRAEAPACRIG